MIARLTSGLRRPGSPQTKLPGLRCEALRNLVVEEAMRVRQARGATQAVSDNELPQVNVHSQHYRVRPSAALNTFLRSIRNNGEKFLYECQVMLTEWLSKMFGHYDAPVIRTAPDARRTEALAADSELVKPAAFLVQRLKTSEHASSCEPFDLEAADVQAPSDGLAWIIATSDPAHRVKLDRVCEKYFGKKYEQLTLDDETRRLTKVGLRPGNILNIAIPRFTLAAPGGEYYVKRTYIELLINEHAIVAVDHDNDTQVLTGLLQGIKNGEVPTLSVSTPGALAVTILESAFVSNAQVLEHFNSKLAAWKQHVSTHPLDKPVIAHELPDIAAAVDYMWQKTQEAGEIATVFHKLSPAAPGLFGGQRVEAVVSWGEQTLKNFAGRLAVIDQKIDKIAADHDRRRKEHSDKNLEWLTIPITMSAPPIITDFVCDKVFHHHESWHGPLIVGSIVLGCGLVLYKKLEQAISRKTVMVDRSLRQPDTLPPPAVTRLHIAT